MNSFRRVLAVFLYNLSHWCAETGGLIGGVLQVMANEVKPPSPRRKPATPDPKLLAEKEEPPWHKRISWDIPKPKPVRKPKDPPPDAGPTKK